MRYKHYYVPLSLLVSWLGKNGDVPYYDINDKAMKSGKLSKLFYEYISYLEEDDVEMIESLDSVLENALLSFSSGSVHTIDFYLSYSLLLLYLRTPEYKRYYENEMKIVFKGKVGRFNEDEFLISILNEAYERKIYLWDLKAVVVKPAIGKSFILSSNPVLMADPALEKEKENDYVHSDTYALNGAMYILPFRPDRALILYDKNTYNIECGDDGILSIKAEDVDTINRMSTFRSKVDGRFVVPEGMSEEEIQSLMDYHEIEFSPDYLYPFPVEFSFIKINVKKSKTYVRDYVDKIRKLDIENKMNKITDVDKLESYLEKRDNFARSLI